MKEREVKAIEELKIAYLNTAGIQNNIAYVNRLADETNLLILSEHWETSQQLVIISMYWKKTSK